MFFKITSCSNNVSGTKKEKNNANVQTFCFFACFFLFVFNLASTFFPLSYTLSKLPKHDQHNVLTGIPTRSIPEKCPLKLQSVRCCLDSWRKDIIKPSKSERRCTEKQTLLLPEVRWSPSWQLRDISIALRAKLEETQKPAQVKNLLTCMYLQ